MNKLFDLDNPVMEFLSKLFDLIVLNMLYIVSCIPIVTIGASTSALYYVCLKMYRGHEPYIWKNYWKAFRQNFKQSTLVWLIMFVAFGFLWMDFQIINTQDTSVFSVIRVALWIIGLFLICIYMYIFPILSHFECTTKQAFKNAALMIIAHLPNTIILLAMYGIIFYIPTMSSGAYAMEVCLAFLCGFSVVAYLACSCFDRVFKRYEPEEEEIVDRFLSGDWDPSDDSNNSDDTQE